MTRSLLSSLALVAALGFSGAAMAQTVVAGKTITAEELPYVQQQCDSLAVADRTSLASETEDNDAADDGADDESTADPAAKNADGANSSAVASVTSIDLDLLTLDQCKEAGLVQ